jgi:hypothetical protein
MSNGPVRGCTEDSSGDPSWRHYAHTILEIELDPPMRIDLRRAIAPSIAERLRRASPIGQVSVITPYNPRGRCLGDQENERRLCILVSELEAKRLPFARADGVSPDGLHRECGVSLPIPVNDAVTLAIRFGQSALFWFDGSSMWLVPALLGGKRRLLPID